MGMGSDYRKKLFDDYLETSYKKGNILSEGQLLKASEAFERDYEDLLPVDKQARILDLGCGIGDFLYHLRNKGYTNFYGVDISSQQVEYCRQHVSDRVELADGRNFLADKKGVYDLISAHDVMEHIPKQELLPYLELVRDALKVGGIFIMRVPNMSNPLGLDARYNDFTHEVGFTGKSIEQVLGISGFKQVAMLPPRKIPVRSLPNLIRLIMVRLSHRAVKFLYYMLDYTVPQNLDKNLVAVARK